MFKAKYVIIDDRMPRIFTEVENHSDMVRHGEKCTSAGFVYFSANRHGNVVSSCYGESISLGLKADPERDKHLIDTFILNRNS